MDCPKCKNHMEYLDYKSFTGQESTNGDFVLIKPTHVFSGATYAKYYHCKECKTKYAFHDGPFGIASCSEKDKLPGEDVINWRI